MGFSTPFMASYRTWKPIVNDQLHTPNENDTFESVEQVSKVGHQDDSNDCLTETESTDSVSCISSETEFISRGRSGSNSSFTMQLPINPFKLFMKPKHARSRCVSEISESDFLPFAPGTYVATKFGLGTLVKTRDSDSVQEIHIQSYDSNITKPLLIFYAGPLEDDIHSVPALLHEVVETPYGRGRVLSYNKRQQMYTINITATTEYTCKLHQSEVQHILNSPLKGVSTIKGGRRKERPHSGAINAVLSSAIQKVVATSSGISNSTYNYVTTKMYQGQCVDTPYGQGTIVAVGESSIEQGACKMLKIQLIWGATVYLNTATHIYYMKALVGHEVMTRKFGPGVIIAIRPQDAIYTVQLQDQDIVYVHESDISRDKNGFKQSATSVAACAAMHGVAQLKELSKLGFRHARTWSYDENSGHPSGGRPERHVSFEIDDDENEDLPDIKRDSAAI